MTADKVDPIHQFRIFPLVEWHPGGYDLSFTNASLFMVLIVVCTGAYFYFTTRGRRIIPTRAQSVSEMFYEFTVDMLKDAAGEEGMRFFPFVFTLFAFVTIANIIGMVPHIFEVTAQLVVTAALALVVFFMVVIAGLMRHGLHFFRLFVPKDIPKPILPVIIVIEVISFLTRPVSHSVRLFANMLAGHITIKVFAGFVFTLGTYSVLGLFAAPLPLAMVVALSALEILIAFLQAYVFAMLTCIYLNDAIHPGH